MFVSKQYDTLPDEHSQSGSHPAFGTGCRKVAAYQVLFAFRDPFQLWLIDSRPRNAVSTQRPPHTERTPALTSQTIINLPEAHKFDSRTTNWFVSEYLGATDDPLLPLGQDVLDGVQFGGKRNYGYGIAQLAYTKIIDLDEIKYTCFRTVDAFILELTTPYVLESSCPDADDNEIPWREESRDVFGERSEKIVEQR